MSYDGVLVHTARRLDRVEEGGEYVEGRIVTRELEPEEIQTFPCCLFLPQGDEDGANARGGRDVKRPTLLLPRLNDEGQPLTVPQDTRLGITAAELYAGEVIWQVQGSATLFGRPGRPIKGQMVTLLRITE